VQRAAQRVPDGAVGIQRRERVLEHHLHVLADSRVARQPNRSTRRSPNRIRTVSGRSTPVTISRTACTRVARSPRRLV
jgi:hypothetical protein